MHGYLSETYLKYSPQPIALMGKKGKPKINEMLNWRKSKNMLLKMLMTLQLKEIFT
jgi:hypothetical protein